MDAAARGSTVIDLFIVVAIVVILAVILFPVFAEFSSGSVRPTSGCTCSEQPTPSVPCLAEGPDYSDTTSVGACSDDHAQSLAGHQAHRAGLLGCAAVACAAIMIGILFEGGRRP